MKIEFQNIAKEYKKNVFGVRDINITIPGGVFGLLGRNGAGKTTLMRLLATIISPTKGKIFFDGKNLAVSGNEFRQKLGYLPQNTKLQPTLTVYEFLDYIAVLKNIKDKEQRKKEIEKCLEIVGLQNEKKKKLGAYSGGMLRRAGIAQALLGNPEILIVDEPTTGLDPEERLYFRNLISKIGKDKTIILSTHIISDIENISERVGIMEDGNVIYNGSIKTLLSMVQDKVWQCKISAEMIDEVKKKVTVTAVTYNNDGSVIRYISDESIDSTSEKKEATLEDAYIYTIGGIKR